MRYTNRISRYCFSYGGSSNLYKNSHLCYSLDTAFGLYNPVLSIRSEKYSVNNVSHIGRARSEFSNGWSNLVYNSAQDYNTPAKTRNFCWLGSFICNFSKRIVHINYPIFNWYGDPLCRGLLFS